MCSLAEIRVYSIQQFTSLHVQFGGEQSVQCTVVYQCTRVVWRGAECVQCTVVYRCTRVVWRRVECTVYSSLPVYTCSLAESRVYSVQQFTSVHMQFGGEQSVQCTVVYQCTRVDCRGAECTVYSSLSVQTCSLAESRVYSVQQFTSVHMQFAGEQSVQCTVVHQYTCVVWRGAESAMYSSLPVYTCSLAESRVCNGQQFTSVHVQFGGEHSVQCTVVYQCTYVVWRGAECVENVGLSPGHPGHTSKSN